MTRNELNASLGPYRLVRRLGAGGMGEVWQAEAPDGRAVAVKRLLGDEENASNERKFLDEARLGASFDHPNLVRVLDVGSEGQWLYLVMELLRGTPFSRLHELAAGPLPIGMVIELAIQALSGLAAMHEHRAPTGELRPVIHRDIKPSNLFLTEEGTVKIIDFGIAFVPGADRTRTRTGQFRGSLPYSSPEQARGETPDARSDLFSFGLVLHELLTGRRVFSQETDAALVTALLWNPIPRASAERDDVPEVLDGAVASSLQRERDLRPASARALAARLEAAIDPARRWAQRDLAAWLSRAPRPKSAAKAAPAAPEYSTGPSAGAPPTADTAPLPAISPKRRPVLRTAVAVAGLAALAAAAFALRPSPEPDSAPSIPPEASVAVKAASAAAPSADTVKPSQTIEASAPGRATEPATAAAAKAMNAAPRPQTAQLRTSTAPARRKAAPRPAFGWLTVDAQPVYGKVYVDGRAVGVTPLYRLRAAAGRHEVEVRRDDGATRRRTVVVAADAEKQVLLEW